MIFETIVRREVVAKMLTRYFAELEFKNSCCVN